MDYIAEEFKKSDGVDLKNDPMALQRIKEAAEKAKVELSTSTESEINLPFITADAAGPKHLVMKLTRAKLEQLTGDLIEKTVPLVEQVLKDAKVSPNDISEVILVGGQTRMPLIQSTVKKIFGKEPNKSVNPDEVVALGAGLQAGVLGGEVKDLLLLDVTPLTLGLETLGSVMTPLIEKNTTIPTSKSQIFSTAADNQTSVEIHILQGERAMSADNRTLGRFMLDGIPPAPRGVPQVEVTFDIDANGILNVKAQDKATSKEQKITITSSSGLSKEEIEKMQTDAASHEEEDKKKKELIDTKNLAENLVYTAEKALKDAGDKVPAEDKKEIEAKISTLKETAKTDNLEKIKTDTETLSQVIQKIGQAMYGKQADSSQPTADSKTAEHAENKEKPKEQEKPEDKKE
jgi:molecular chaperone DnaK